MSGWLAIMHELVDGPTTSGASSSEDSIDVLMPQPCSEVLARLATIAEPYSFYAAMIPGERNRRVDFWIRVTGNRFDAWPKARIQSLVSSAGASSYYLSSVKGVVLPQPEGCRLKASVHEGHALPNARLAQTLGPALVAFVAIVALVTFVLSGLTSAGLRTVAWVAAFSILFWGMMQLAKSQHKMAFERNRPHLRRFIAILRTDIPDLQPTPTELEDQQTAYRTELSL